MFSFQFVISTTISFDLCAVSPNKKHAKFFFLYFEDTLFFTMYEIYCGSSRMEMLQHTSMYLSRLTVRDFFIWYYLQLSISVRFCFLLILIKTPRKQHSGLSTNLYVNSAICVAPSIVVNLYCACFAHLFSSCILNELFSFCCNVLWMASMISGIGWSVSKN